MIKQLMKSLVNKFVQSVNAHNKERHLRIDEQGYTDFEDDVEPTFKNFIRWLNH